MNAIIFLRQDKIPKVTPEILHWIESQLPPEAHPERAQSFLLSRLALKMALESVLKHEISIKDIRLDHHHFLNSFPGLHASLSHTKDAAVAWVRNHKGHGIDLERLDRPIKESIWERIHHPQDDKGLTRLELWCLKEAAFKALYNAGHIHGPIPFAEIVFRKDGIWQWKSVTGHYQTSLQDQEWQLAQAWFN